MTAGMIAVAVAPAVTPPPPSSAATPAPATTTTISVTQPAAVLLLAVLHFIPGTDDPAGIVAALASVLGRAASW
ncbi:MAG TPA: SAM-dependent methyltransferase [Streptosporangiaceae bacterium]|nr:SAM-dependent methyltransferase [Streptosporangiaceae bacterium]